MKLFLLTSIISLILFGFFGVSSYGESSFETKFTIDKPPNLGDIANITITFTLSPNHKIATIEHFPISIQLPDGLEVVSGEL